MKVNPILPLLFGAILFFACSNRPSHVLSEKKMEKVLFDIYLADAEINSNYAIFSSDSARKQDLLNSVLKKHKITEAVLDTSLAWYSGHLDKYLKINDNLTKRFTGMAENLRRREAAERKENSMIDKDALILPVENRQFFLTVGDLRQKAYAFRADTTLNRYGGTYQLQFEVLGIPASLHPVVTLCVRCTDTTFVKRDTIRQNGLFSSSLAVLSGKQAKELHGSVYFTEIYPDIAIFIQNFTLSHSFNPQLKEKKTEIR